MTHKPQEADRVPNTTTIYDEIPDLDTIGGRLSRAREASGQSIKQVAWRLGVKMSTVQAWESDRAQPGAHRLNTLSGILNVSLSWVLHGIGTGPVEIEDDEDDFETGERVEAQLNRLKLLHAETGNLIERIQNDMERRAVA
ncbi:helix-turn-helix domain-containing protein [Pseudaminobacter sp. NGMCC 1.201702]|uniref:helix-turn-helix domain-containing protein n=1 Tax=Pseudaminobacter sp. NGMCC 1.201702 TaxID=3391825 RepID=UPI0039F123CC